MHRLEIPCVYRLYGPTPYIDKMELPWTHSWCGHATFLRAWFLMSVVDTADLFRLANLFWRNVYASGIVPVCYEISGFVPGVLL